MALHTVNVFECLELGLSLPLLRKIFVLGNRVKAEYLSIILNTFRRRHQLRNSKSPHSSLVGPYDLKLVHRPRSLKKVYQVRQCKDAVDY